MEVANQEAWARDSALKSQIYASRAIVFGLLSPHHDPQPMYSDYEDDRDGETEPPVKRAGGYRIEVCPNNRAKCKGESQSRRRVASC